MALVKWKKIIIDIMVFCEFSQIKRAFYSEIYDVTV